MSNKKQTDDEPRCGSYGGGRQDDAVTERTGTGSARLPRNKMLCEHRPYVGIYTYSNSCCVDFGRVATATDQRMFLTLL